MSKEKYQTGKEIFDAAYLLQLFDLAAIYEPKHSPVVESNQGDYNERKRDRKAP